MSAGGGKRGSFPDARWRWVTSAAFERAYSETMSRTGAAERYLYPTSYFARLLLSDPSWLILAEREDAGLAGAIVAASDGYLHYYLGGTADEALRDSPMKNLFWAMIGLGEDLGVPVNLGGGVTPGDSLDEFKRGFAESGASWHTHEVICDAAAYAELSGPRGRLRRGSSPPTGPDCPSPLRRRLPMAGRSGSAARGRCRDRCRGNCGSRRGRSRCSGGRSPCWSTP